MSLNRRDRELAREIARQIRRPPVAPTIEYLPGWASATGAVIFLGGGLWILQAGAHWLFWGIFFFIGSAMPLLHLSWRTDIMRTEGRGATMVFGTAYTLGYGLTAYVLVSTEFSAISYWLMLLSIGMCLKTINWLAQPNRSGL
jgi:hypothetical protein